MQQNRAVTKFKNCESGRSSEASSMTQGKGGSGICDSDKHFNAGDTGKQKDPTACDVSKQMLPFGNKGFLRIAVREEGGAGTELLPTQPQGKPSIRNVGAIFSGALLVPGDSCYLRGLVIMEKSISLNALCWDLTPSTRLSMCEQSNSVAPIYY